MIAHIESLGGWPGWRRPEIAFDKGLTTRDGTLLIPGEMV